MPSLAKPAALLFEHLTLRGLQLPSDLSYAQWEKIGRSLYGIGRSLQWAVGDWLNYGEAKFGEKASQAMSAVGYEYQTLANCRWVCERVEFSRRRELPFSLHAEVAALDPSDQDRWLDRAETNNWTRAKLREALGKGRKALSEGPCPPHRCAKCGVEIP